MTLKRILLAALFLFPTLISCSKNKPEDSAFVSGNVLELHPGEVKKSESVPAKWSGDEGTVIVVFGYGYNEKKFYEEAESILAEKFGLAENGGLVQCMKFPDDFHGRISNLRSVAEESNLRGIVIFGAPEGSHFTFASIRDGRDNLPDLNIFSFFPQDDVLGQEGTSTFVLDHEATGMMKLEDQDQIIDSDIFEIILAAVRYAAILPAEVPADNELHAHVQSIVGKRKVHRFVDGESGIQARNHFVIEPSE